ncbi:hypothetical protein Rcae01_00676 [Novipirellula caenicola]|uniref:Uncharacterized protein n=1 Tax=Novipirellula caenicola TaxID=1536901 RepID=A0ABP9VJ43_9BACT
MGAMKVVSAVSPMNQCRKRPPRRTTGNLQHVIAVGSGRCNVEPRSSQRQHDSAAAFFLCRLVAGSGSVLSDQIFRFQLAPEILWDLNLH